MKKYFSLRCALARKIFLATFLLAYGTQGLCDGEQFKAAGSITPNLSIGDEVDIKSLSLEVRHADLHLPGNGGLDITIQRSYSTNKLSANGLATHNRSYKWGALGPGWTMLVAPRITEAYHRNDSYTRIGELCKGNTFASLYPNIPAVVDEQYLPILELPDGSQHAIYSDGNKTAITKSNWKIDCTNGILTASSPNGMKYNFGNHTANLKRASHTITLKVTSQNDRPIVYAVRHISATQATDVMGNSISYSYNTYGTTRSTSDLEYDESPSYSPSKITSSDGREVNFTYDSFSGRLTRISDNTGKSVLYNYLTPNTLNSRSLSKVTLPDGSSWVYQYAPGNFVDGLSPSEIKPINRQLASIKYPSGGTINYTYQSCGNLRRLIDPNLGDPWGEVFAESSRGCIASKQLSSGEKWNYSPSSSNGFDFTDVVGPEGKTTYKFMGFDYAFSNSTTPSIPDASTPSSFFHNNLWQVGQLLEKTFPNGARENYKWKPRKIANLRVFAYDLGWVYDEDTWAADLEERAITLNGAAYKTTLSNYDQYGFPGQIIESGINGGNRTTTLTYYHNPTKWILGKPQNISFSGSITSHTYDNNGNLTNLTRNGITTQHTYDPQGNLATKTLPRGIVHSYSNYKRGIAQTEIQPEGITVYRTVDNAGNITSETDGEGKTTTYTHDGLNRILSITYPSGNAKTITYTSTTKTATRGSLIESTQYDSFGRPASVTLGGVKTIFTYDIFGRKIFVSNPDASIGTNYQYDVFNRVTKITNADGTQQNYTYGAGTTTFSDERNKKTTFTYRSYGNPSQQFLMSISSPEPSTNISIVRNTNDLITSVTQAGITRNYEYYNNNYLKSATNPETGITTYGRDAAGNMTSRQIGNSGMTAYSYDSQNRLISASYPNGTSANHSYNKNHKMLTANSGSANRGFSYDANGNLINESVVIDGLTFSTIYSYNANDQLSAITYPRSGRIVNYSPDTLGRPTKVSDYVNSVSYWPSGMIKQINYANGTNSTYAQNSRLWPSSFSTAKTGVFTYINSAYTYDGVGNLTSINDPVDFFFNRTLGYDNINRLSTVIGPWGSGTISYDGAGNITNQALGGTNLSYYYDSNNRLANINGTRSASYTYDNYGNVAGSTGNTYTYDDVPNLRCINCSSANKIEYNYDATNNRILVAKAGVKTYEIYGSHGNQLIEFTPSQNKLVEYIYLGGKRVAQRVSP